MQWLALSMVVCLLVTVLPQTAGAQTVTVTTTEYVVVELEELENLSTGISVHWAKYDDAEGYKIYRKDTSDGSYTKVKTVTGADVLYWTDTDVINGGRYEYKVKAYYTVTETVETPDEDTNDGSADDLTDDLTDDGSSDETDDGSADDLTDDGSSDETDDGSADDLTDDGSSDETDDGAADDSTDDGGTDSLSAAGLSSAAVTTRTDLTPASDTAYHKTIWRLTAPKISSFTQKKYANKTLKKLLIEWSQNKYATGYEIQYSTKSSFKSKKTVTVTKASTLKKTIKSLKAGKTYYIRIRSYKKVGGVKYYSAWRLSSNAKSTSTSNVSYKMKTKKKKIELRSLAGCKTKGYDTLQGTTTDGTYLYYILYNRTKGKCKIAKLRLSDMKFIKISKALSIGHGNDLTYNASANQLVVVTLGSKTLTLVDADTLKQKSRIKVSLPEKLSGTTKAKLASCTGYSAIAYSASKNQYIVLMRNSARLLVLDENFTPLRVIACGATSMTNQGIECHGDYIYRALSKAKSGQSNAVYVYDWEGNLIRKIKLKKTYELEDIYFVGSTMYAGVYRSYYTTVTKKVTKKVKVKGSKKKKKVTKKVKVRKLVRDNYICKVTGF